MGYYFWGVNVNYVFVNLQFNLKVSEELNKISVFVDKKLFLIIVFILRFFLEGIVQESFNSM